ncbi:MAG: radical SAM family heme chaperone HemW [Chloroflexota bacterium]
MKGKVRLQQTEYLYLSPSSDTNGRISPDSEAAIYLHFPFCAKRCSYCDFDSFSGLDGLIETYLEAVLQQMQMSPRALGTSLYLGGGTPSLMAPPDVAKLVSACRDRFSLHSNAEVTLEANPSDLDREKLAGYRDAGVNRLSIGVQSTDEGLLRLLGRRHGPVEARSSIAAARDAGFRNVSVDLIFGMPRQDRSIWEHTLREVAVWGVEHISCYSLTVERGTALEKAISQGILSLPQEDEIVGMYRAAERVLSVHGYRRYEISNWAKPGFESRHNLAYWSYRPYLGIGAGAAGFWNSRRYKIVPDIPRYIEGVRAGRIPLCENDEISRRRAMSDFLILGLRLSDGVPASRFEASFGTTPQAVFGEALEWGIREGLLERQEDRLVLTPQGTLLSNELFEKLL